MQKIISLLALLIFSFSLVGEDVSDSFCVKTAISQNAASALHTDASSSTSASLEKDIPVKAPETAAHDCHFGHCSYTLIILPIVASPASHLELAVERLYQSVQSGFRSETLRPPSLA